MKLNDWRRVKDRLQQMDRDELRDRVRQEFGKRQDGLLSRLGFDFARGSRNSNVFQESKFFFAPDSIESLTALLRQRLPSQVKQILKQAEKICDHRFDLLGYELDYGSPIDWHLDPVHQKRAPRKLFYKVRYLDFDEVGDSKITWELNRHQHFVTLAKAYRLTGNPRFVDELLLQWRQWQADNPYPIGINWASSLEVAFRSLSWIWTYHLLQGDPRARDFRQEWLPGLARHGRHIERYLSTYFSPNTHLLGEGVALFFLGVLCPELERAERWRQVGWNILVQESDRQVQGDGFHFEQSTYYHVYALDFFLHSAILANRNDIALPPGFEKTLEKMLGALCLLGRFGSPPRFGDDDGGRLFDPRRNRGEHLLDPLSTGAILFNRGDLKHVAADLREETIWLLGAEGVRRWDELPGNPPNTQSAVLHESGFYFLAAADTRAQLVVHAGPLGTQSGGHGHADALSFCLQSNASLIDPGTCEYVGRHRDLFRGTAMHNTLRVDNTNQAEITGPFSWKRLTQSKVEECIQGPSFDLLAASHDGYHRLLQPVTHTRWVVSLKNGLYFVRDVVAGEGRRRLDIPLRLAQDMELVGENQFRVKGTTHGLAIVPAPGQGWEAEVRQETWSPVYGQEQSTTVLNFSTTAEMPAEFAFILVCLEEVHPTARSFTRLQGEAQEPGVAAYQYSGDGQEYSFFFGTAGKSWRHQGVSSDAAFVCWKRSRGSSDHLLIVANGSYTEVAGGPEIRCRQAVCWGELSFQGGRKSVRTSNSEAVERSHGMSLPADKIE